MTLSPSKLKELLHIIVKDSNNSNAPNYFKGAKLVELFNAVGFEDDYDFGNTESAFRMDDRYVPKSRTDYVKHRLNCMNKRGDIESIIEPLISMADNKQLMRTELGTVFTMDRYDPHDY